MGCWKGWFCDGNGVLGMFEKVLVEGFVEKFKTSRDFLKRGVVRQRHQKVVSWI